MRISFEAILRYLRRKRVAQGPFMRLFGQQQNQNAAGNARPANPAAPRHGRAHDHAAQTAEHALHVYDQPEREMHRTTFSQVDPNTMSVVDHSEEHNTAGVRATEITTHKVLTDEGFYVCSQQIEGLCSTTGKVAVKIYHCLMPGCGRNVCRVHSIPLDPNNPEAEHARICLACAEKLAFERNTWGEFFGG